MKRKLYFVGVENNFFGGFNATPYNGKLIIKKPAKCKFSCFLELQMVEAFDVNKFFLKKVVSLFSPAVDSLQDIFFFKGKKVPSEFTCDGVVWHEVRRVPEPRVLPVLMRVRVRVSAAPPSSSSSAAAMAVRGGGVGCGVAGAEAWADGENCF